MSAIAQISGALAYDAVEEMLARGASLRDCYAFAAVALDSAEVNDHGPDSTAPTLAPRADLSV